MQRTERVNTHRKNSSRSFADPQSSRCNRVRLPKYQDCACPAPARPRRAGPSPITAAGCRINEAQAWRRPIATGNRQAIPHELLSQREGPSERGGVVSTSPSAGANGHEHTQLLTRKAPNHLLRNNMYRQISRKNIETHRWVTMLRANRRTKSEEIAPESFAGARKGRQLNGLRGSQTGREVQSTSSGRCLRERTFLVRQFRGNARGCFVP